MTTRRRRWFGLGAGFALAGMIAIGGMTGQAQEATPIGDEAMGGASAHPAHIHVGNCETLDPNPLVPLADVTFVGTSLTSSSDAASPEASPGAAMASPVADDATGSEMAIDGGHSTTNVPLPLSGILAAEHAINIHLSQEDIEVYVACGAIGGAPDANGDLFIGLEEQNDSGVSGIAWLHDNGDGASTTVTLVLAFDLSPDAGAAAPVESGATPEASPAS